MFSRKKSETPESPVQEASSHSDPTGKKGHATPTRREAEARRHQPLVPADRKEAKRQAKIRRDAAYQRQQEALVTGDERYLPVRDKGRVRRYARDWVDARWSFSEFVVPVMLIFLVAMMAASFLQRSPEVANAVVLGMTFVFYGLLIVSVVEGVIVWMRLRKRIQERYPDDEIPRGTWFYVYSRMVMARRWRSPKPQVDRGQFPQTGPRR
ncbi:DUF3043 domain-containing protein [Actinomyces provencensis]|uniref:DUF3043 domain-containing protein n=1 Tax=Actinomyces provencensis TaxID=1720198 RepID=UPI00096A51ED|nr:DUF3043 domain-containing protein [Actinomyces provencensis]